MRGWTGIRGCAAALVVALVAADARAALDAEEIELRVAIEGWRAEMVERLRAWVERNTGSENLPGLQRFAALLPAELTPLGFAVETREGGRVELGPGQTRALGPLVIARRPAGTPRARRFLLVGHYDTVFEPDSPFQRFEASPDGARATGPGASDMKGGLVVLLYALRALAETGALDRADWTLLLNADEELGSPGSREVIEREARRAELGLVFESAHEGGAMVASRRGVGEFVLDVRGVSAHAGNAHSLGRSAVRALADKILKLEALTDYERGVTVNVGTVRGGTKRNAVPDFAEAGIDVRFDRAADGAALKAGIERIAAETAVEGTSASLRGGLHRPAKPESDGTRRLLEAHAAVARDLGLPLAPPAHSGGGTDGSLMAAVGLATLDSLGATGGGAHTEREHVDLASLPERAALAAILLRRLATVAQPTVQ
jgi:glutamate carboxypeptidase